MCSLFVALLLYLILVFLAFEEVALQGMLERELKPDVGGCVWRKAGLSDWGDCVLAVFVLLLITGAWEVQPSFKKAQFFLSSYLVIIGSIYILL